MQTFENYRTKKKLLSISSALNELSLCHLIASRYCAPFSLRTLFLSYLLDTYNEWKFFLKMYFYFVQIQLLILEINKILENSYVNVVIQIIQRQNATNTYLHHYNRLFNLEPLLYISHGFWVFKKLLVIQATLQRKPQHFWNISCKCPKM